MTQAQGERVYNFSAGPAVLPLPALLKAQSELICLGDAGASVMEISHRSKQFDAVLQGAKANVRALLAVPENYHILFIQGGASLQFSMAPMNLLRGAGKTADYIITGSWGQKALKEAKREGACNLAFDGKPENFVRVPGAADLKLTLGAAYVHFTSNETIQGVQFPTEPETNGVPLVCDASSDILSRPVAIEKYGVLYAGAQKNIGPSGVALVIIRDDLIASVPENLPSMLDYKVTAENDSLYNTPPTFAIYMIKLVTDWLIETQGDLAAMQKANETKAQMLYDAIDNSGGFYKGHAQKEFRSAMNVTWTLAGGADQEADFIKQAAAKGLASLKGHRSVGGIRASIYNAMPAEGVEALRDFMTEYQKKSG
jgi:phosphoserine aminotransferase